MSKKLEDTLEWTNIWLVSILIIIVIQSCNAHAADPDNVVLTTGEKSPYSGVLLPTARAQRVLTLDLNYQYLQTIDGLKDQEITILNTRVNNANTEANNLSDRLAKQNEYTWLKEVGLFFLGAAAATVTAYGVSRALK